jgi:hypothetical protein
MGRLPTNVKPIHYDISIEPDLESSTFEGAVSIEYYFHFFAIYSLLNPGVDRL